MMGEMEEDDTNRSEMGDARHVSVKQLRTSFEVQGHNTATDSTRIIARTGGRERLHKNFPVLGDSANKEDGNSIMRRVSPEKGTSPDTIGKEKLYRSLPFLGDVLKEEDTSMLGKYMSPERRTFSDSSQKEIACRNLGGSLKNMDDQNLIGRHVHPQLYSSSDSTPIENQWKKEAKAGIKVLLDDQRCHWKSAEESIANLERRLTLLEMENERLQDSLSERKAEICCNQSIENTFNLGIDEKAADFPKGYPCIYVSPLFEEWRSTMGYYKRADLSLMEQRKRQKLFSEDSILRKSISSQGWDIPGETERLNPAGIRTEENPVEKLGQGNEKNRASSTYHQSSFGQDCICSSRELIDPSKQTGHIFSSQQAGVQSNFLHRNKKDGYGEVKEHLSVEPSSPDQEVHGISNRVKSCDCSEEIRRWNDRMSFKRNVITNSKAIDQRRLAKCYKSEVAADAFNEQDQTLNLKAAIEKLLSACQEYEEKMHDNQVAIKVEENKGIYHSVSLQQVYVDVLLEICRQLGDFGKELNNSLTEADWLQQQFYDLKEALSTSGSKYLPLATHHNKKEELIEKLRLKIKSVQDEKDVIATQNVELIKRLTELDKQSAEKNKCANELAIVSRELLVLSQSEENELAYLRGKLMELQQALDLKCLEAGTLALELEGGRRKMHEKEEEFQFLRIMYSALEFKLAETEYELEQREATLERLATHMASTVEFEYLFAEKNPPLWGSLRYMNRKDRVREHQIRHSRMIIRTLDEHLTTMQDIAEKAKLEMARPKAQNIENID